ncbi:Sodium/potassium/calcium exchanger 5 [Orchesella cincta]|uniref:Sodium/potassium/calcium exchanger 5 n=1 Tax=Orchesella cincta TaxID=48709 RepID=A0A1D2MT55_ORCCI|nr:Sodium/potassium/calcium exchanger 5 [Orchesella cincta]
MFLLAYNSILDSMSSGRRMEYNLELSQSTTLDGVWDRSKGKPLIIIVVLCIAIIFLCVMSDDSPPEHPSGKNDTGHGNKTIELRLYENFTTNCTPPPIDSFPQDLFTQEERRHGFVLVHIAVSIYVFYCLAIICDEYLVPSIDCICEEYHVSSSIAGATFMAIATSSPELFTNVIGTFLTKGDIGIGTVVGSAIINVLGVCACCGIAAKNPLPVDVYPLTRDCLFYSATVVLLVFVMRNEQIFWHEALVLVLAYAIYMLVMLNNATVKRKLDNIIGKIRSTLGLDSKPYDEEDMNQNSSRIIGNSSLRSERTPLMAACKDEDEEIFMSNILYRSRILAAGDAEAKWSLAKPPPLEKGVCAIILWVMSWPPRFVFTLTIPDCRKENWRKFSIITLFVCVLWIGASSYLISWMMTVIGHTLSVPNSVMGLVFLSVGATTPEIVSSIIVARQGHGTMSISNSLGSNIFNILICLGLPWLIRSSMIAGDAKNYIQINSGGLEYSVASLLLAVFLLYVILAANRFYLDRKVGLIALILYCIFILFASLFELNVFFIVNLPICKHMNN